VPLSADGPFRSPYPLSPHLLSVRRRAQKPPVQGARLALRPPAGLKRKNVPHPGLARLLAGVHDALCPETSKKTRLLPFLSPYICRKPVPKTPLSHQIGPVRGSVCVLRDAAWIAKSGKRMPKKAYMQGRWESLVWRKDEFGARRGCCGCSDWGAGEKNGKFSTKTQTRAAFLLRGALWVNYGRLRPSLSKMRVNAGDSIVLMKSRRAARCRAVKWPLTLTR